MSKPKDISSGIILLAILVVVMIISLIVFLNTTDGYGQYQITGKEVVKQMGTQFWVFVALGIVASVIFFILAYCNEKGTWIAKNWPGSMGLTILFCILALLSLILPWLPALEAKANGGATLPKQNTSYENNRSYNSCSYWCCGSDAAHGISVKG